MPYKDIEARRAHSKKYQEENKNTQREYRKEYRKKNPQRRKASRAKHRASKLQAVPSWMNKEEQWLIEEVYDLSRLRTELTGVQWHVDHVVPLQGKEVCGLHTIDNLQLLTAYDNISKGNKHYG